MTKLEALLTALLQPNHSAVTLQVCEKSNVLFDKIRDFCWIFAVLKKKKKKVKNSKKQTTSENMRLQITMKRLPHHDKIVFCCDYELLRAKTAEKVRQFRWYRSFFLCLHFYSVFRLDTKLVLSR